MNNKNYIYIYIYNKSYSKTNNDGTGNEPTKQNQETVELLSEECLNNENVNTNVSQMTENTKKDNEIPTPRKMLEESADTEKTKEVENKNNVTEEEMRCKNETKETIDNDSKMNNNETGSESTGNKIKAAVKIQSVIRGYFARNIFKKLLKKNGSKIDQQFETQVGSDQRIKAFKREISKYNNLTKMFVINEQNSYQSERNDKLGNTIHTTENNLKGVAPTAEKLILTSNVNDAALKIQSVWRGHKTRKSLKELELKTLQARTECDELPEQRGLLSRADTVKAAIVIQALFRGYVVRKHENTILRKKKSLEEKLLTVPEDKENVIEENKKINKIADSDIFDALKQLDEAPIPPNSPKVEDAGVKLTRSSTVEEPIIESKHFSPLTRSISADDYSHKEIDLLEKFDDSLSKRDIGLDLTKSIEDLTNIIDNESVLEKIDDVKGNVKKSEDYEPTSNERQSVETNKISDEKIQKIEEIKNENVSTCIEKIKDSDVKFEGSIDETKKSERKDENEMKEKSGDLNLAFRTENVPNDDAVNKENLHEVKENNTSEKTNSHPKTLNEDLNEIEKKGDSNLAFRTENVPNGDAVNKENLHEVKENKDNISEKSYEISNLNKMKQETEEKSQIEETKKIESGLAEKNDKETHQKETESDRTHSENLETFPQEISEKNDEKCADEEKIQEETDNKIKENVNKNVDKDFNDVNLNIKDNLKVSGDKNDKNEETKKEDKFALNLPNDKIKFSDVGNVGNEEKPNKNLTSIIEEVDLETPIIENAAQEENTKNKSFTNNTNNQTLRAKEETFNSKSKQIVLDPIQENLFDQEAAATTIQKNYRGYRARKKQHKTNDDTTKNNTIKSIVDEDKSERNANKKEHKTNDDTTEDTIKLIVDEDKSEGKKESSKTTEDFSNNKIEENIKSEQFTDTNLNTATSKMINRDDKIADPNVAATTIQKNYKGYRARRDLKKVQEEKNMDLRGKINGKDVTVEKIQNEDNQKMIVKKEGDDPTITEGLLQEKNETDNFVSKNEEDQDLNKTGFLKSNKGEETEESSNDKQKKYDLVVGNDVCDQGKKVEGEIDKANIYKMENTTLKKMEENCKTPLLSENKLDNKDKGINEGIINKETAEDNKALVDVNKQMNLIAENDPNGNDNIIFEKDDKGGCDFKQRVNGKNSNEKPTVKNVENDKSQLLPENGKLIEEPFVGKSDTVEENEDKNKEYTKASLNSVTSNVSREKIEEIEASTDTSNNSEISKDEHVDNRINEGIINKETIEDVNKQMNLIAENDCTNDSDKIIFQKDGNGGCDFKQKVINDKNNDEEPTVKKVEDNKSQLNPEKNKLIEEPFVGKSDTVEESEEKFEETEANKDTSNNSEIFEDKHVDKRINEGIINKETMEDNKASEDVNKQMHLFAGNDNTNDSDKIIFQKDGNSDCDFKQKVINDKNNDEEPTMKNDEDNNSQLHPENNKLIEEPFLGKSDTVEENEGKNEEKFEESEASKDTSINSEMSDDTRVYIKDLATSMKEDIHNLKQTLSEDVSVEATQQKTVDGKRVTDLTNSIKNDVLELRKTLLVNNTTNETNEINPIESSTSNKSRTTDRERVNKNTVGSISTPSDSQGEFLNKVTLYTPDAHIDTNPSKRECKENSKQTLQFSNNKQTSSETCGIDTKDELNAETRNKDFNDSIVCESEVFERFSRPVSKESTNSDESADTVIFNEYVDKKTASNEDKLENADAKLETEQEDLKKHQILEEKSSVVHEGKDDIKNNLDEKAQYVDHIDTENNTKKTKQKNTELRSEEIVPKIEAATIIQKNYRGYLARKNLNNTEKNFKKKTNGNEITKYLETITEPIRRAFSAEQRFKNKTDDPPLTHKEENEPQSICIPLRNYGSDETPNDGLEHTNYKNDDKALIHKTIAHTSDSLVDKGTKIDNSSDLTLKKDKENNDKETNSIQHEENFTDKNFAIPSITEESDTTEPTGLEKLSKLVDTNETTKDNVNNLDTKLEKTIEKIDEEITSYLNSIIEPVKQAFSPIKNENTHEISQVIEEPESVYIPLKDYDKLEESELEKEENYARLGKNNMDFNTKFIGKNEENIRTPQTNQEHMTKDTSIKETKVEKNDERNMEKINTRSENEQQKSEYESEVNQNKDLQLEVEEENSINQNEELTNLKKEITNLKLPFQNSFAEKEISNYVKAIVDPIKKTFSPHEDSSEGSKGPANENEQETSIYVPLKDYSLDDNKQVMEIKNDLSHDMDEKIKEEKNLKQLEENDVKTYGDTMYSSEEDMTIENLKRDDNFDILSKENTPKIDQNIIHVKNVETESNHGNGENAMEEFVRVEQKTKESSVDQNEESIKLREETADKKQKQLLNQPYKDLTIVEEEISNYINTIVDPLKKTFSPYKTKDSMGQEIPHTENNQKTSVYIPLKDYSLDERKEEIEMKNNAEGNLEDTNEDNLKKLQEIDAKRKLEKTVDLNEENGNMLMKLADNFELEGVENNQKNDQNTGELRKFENEETKDVTKGNKISNGEENVENNTANSTIKMNLQNNQENVDNVEKMIPNEQLNDQENVEQNDRKDHGILDIQDNLTANQEDRNNHNLKHEPFYLHRDKFYETQAVSQEKAFSEAIKGGRAKKEEMKKEEGLLHSSEFHDGVPVTNKRQTEATTAHNSNTAAPTVLIHSGELHDNVIPLALQMNDAPAGAEIVTSTSRPNVEAHASNKVVLARSNTQNAPQIDRNGGMDAEKRNNCTIAKKKNMEIEAATKIQAGFRGYQVRKQLKKKNSSGSKSSIRRSTRRKSSGRLSDSIKSSQKKKPSQLEEQSATKIQAGIRGFLVRRRQKKNNNTTNETI